MDSRITIITISFNSENTIGHTIEAVLNQGYSNIEYVFVDGVSTDSTNKIIEDYRIRLEIRGIRVVHVSEPDRGISDAFNKGIELATGEIIGIINSDDRLTTNALELVATNFDENTDVLYGNCLWIDELTHSTHIRKSKPDISETRRDMAIMHPATFIRKDAYKKYGKYEVSYRYTMDKELIARFYQKGAIFKYIDIILAEFSAGGASDENFKNVFTEGKKIAIDYGISRPVAIIDYYRKYCRMIIVTLIKKIKKIFK